MNALSWIVRRCSRRRLLPSLLLGLLAWGACAGTAAADACSSCQAPTEAELAAQPGFPAEPWPWGLYGETLACECTYAAGTPTVTQGPAWLVLRGTGEVWNCPESSSEDTISIEIAEGDSTSWSVTTEASATVKTLALELALKVSVGAGGGHTITEVKRVSKTIRAAMGHRIPWEGYFELADFTMEMDVAVKRRWSWWIKHVGSGDEVLVSGSIYRNCGSEHVSLTRRGSIGYRFRLADAPCGAGPATTPTDLGWWPLPKTPPPPPPVTPGTDPVPPPAPTPPATSPPPTTPPTSGPTAPSAPRAPAVDDPDEADDAAGPPQGQPPEGAQPLAPPEPFVWPPPIPTNPHPESSGGLGTPPTGPLPAEPGPYTGPAACEALPVVVFGELP